MKMLISYIYCNQGGVTSVIKQRMPVLLKNGWTVDMAFMVDNGGKSDLLRSGVQNVDIFGTNFKENINRLLGSNKYDLHVIFDTPDLVQSIDYYRKIKVIFEIHTPIIDTIKGYSPAIIKKSNSIFVPSTWSKNTILQFLPSLHTDLIKVVPNIIEIGIFNREGDFYILPQTMLWVGKLADYKNWKEAIKIGATFLEQQPLWNFLAVTGGQNKEDYVVRTLNEFIDHDRINNFRWLHNINQIEMGKLYRGISRSGGFLISTSRAESFCLVIHEAMRCGVPVISTRVGPIDELIQDQVNGLLYNLGNISECLEKCNLYLNTDFRASVIASLEQALSPYDQHYLENIYLDEINRVMAL